MPACAFYWPCLISNDDLSVGNYDDNDNVIQKVCIDNFDECNFMSWAWSEASPLCVQHKGTVQGSQKHN